MKTIKIYYHNIYNGEKIKFIERSGTISDNIAIASFLYKHIPSGSLDKLKEKISEKIGIPKSMFNEAWCDAIKSILNEDDEDEDK